MILGRKWRQDIRFLGGPVSLTALGTLGRGQVSDRAVWAVKVVVHAPSFELLARAEWARPHRPYLRILVDERSSGARVGLVPRLDSLMLAFLAALPVRLFRGEPLRRESRPVHFTGLLCETG